MAHWSEKIATENAVKTISQFFLCTILSLCFSFRISGQSSQEYLERISIEKEGYASATSDSLKLSHFTKIGRLFRFIDVDSSKHYLWKSISMHRANPANGVSHALAYNVLADIYKMESNTDSARHYYEEAHQVFSKNKYSFQFLAIAAPFADFLVLHHESERGIKLYDEAIFIAKEMDYPRHLCYLYNYLGHVLYTVLNDSEKAKEVYLKGLNESQKLEDKLNVNRLTASISLGLSNIFLEEGQIDSTITYALKTVDHGKKSDLLQKVLPAYNNLCLSHIYLEEYNQAEKYNILAHQLYVHAKNKRAKITSETHSQLINLRRKEYKECVQKGREILETNRPQINDQQKADVYENLCECHLMLGNFEEAKNSKDSLLFFTRQTLDLKHEELMNRVYSEYEVKEKEAENKLLKAEQLSVENQLQAQKIAAFILILALIFAIAWAINLYRASKQRKRYNSLLEEQVEEKTKELKDANAELEQSNFELRTLNYIASHDIKEPIKNIGTFAGLIKRRLPESSREEFNPFFQIIINSSKQLYNLIEDFADYISHSKQDNLPLDKVDLNSVIENLKNDLIIIGKYKGANILYHGMPKLISNQSALYVILKNLIENGLKFNTSPHPMVELSYKRKDESHSIIVKDNGIGIDENYQQKIFEMFKRLHERSKYEGTGIGLSLAKLLTEKLDGEILVESIPNKGTTFILNLPLKEKTKVDLNKTQSSTLPKNIPSI